jgi:leucyl aminopeptidase
MIGSAKYAGMFSNDDKLSTSSFRPKAPAKNWRMLLDNAFDDGSKNADMKNTGGRWAGVATAAAFCAAFRGYGMAPYRSGGHRDGR